MKVDEEKNLTKDHGKKKEKTKSDIKELYRYATCLDYFLISVGTLSSCLMGVIQPLFFLFMGDFFGSMGPDTSTESFYDDSKIVCYQLMVCAVLFTFAGYLSVMCFVNVGARQAFHYRRNYFKAIMKCDPSWFDLRQVAELPQSIATETLMIERATGDKLVVLIFTCSMILAALIIALVKGTQLALFCLCFGPGITGGFFLTNSGLEQSSKIADTSYKRAGGIAEEALEEIKTVNSLNGQRHEANKYTEAIKDSQKSMLISGLKVGGGTALGMCSFMLMNGVIFIVGA